MALSSAAPEEEEEFNEIDGDDNGVYEDIEAPKYVDFSVPEWSLPDDASWFCARIGCDQKHEEIDPDTLYKNFVLRVMAARSPNVRLHKSLCQQVQRCPKTEPVKCVNEHRLRFAEKLGNARLKAHPISSLRSTPKSKAKAQPSGVLKDMTAPRSKMQLSKEATLDTSTISSSVPKRNKVGKPVAFCSPKKLQNSATTPRSKKHPPKEATLESSKGLPSKPKNKKLGKSLAFLSPKKVQNSATSTASHAPKSRLCCAMKKLQIDSQTIYNLKDSSKSSKGAPQKDPSNPKVAKSALKSRMVNDSQGIMDKSKDDYCFVHQEGNIASSEMQVDVKSKRSSTGNTNTHSSDSHGVLPMLSDHPDVGSEKENPEDMVNAEAKENALDNSLNFDDGDKENASATSSNRNIHLISREIEIVNDENCEHSLQKATGGPGKCLLENLMQGGKYKKMKPTNPKPFRFRTDERGILKEANLDKRIQHDPVKEIKPTVNPQRKKQLESNIVIAELKSGSNKPKMPLLHSHVNSQSNATSANLLSKDSKIGRVLKLKEEESAASTMPLRLRKPTTIPREPVFHKMHVPKNCTKRPMQPIS